MRPSCAAVLAILLFIVPPVSADPSADSPSLAPSDSVLADSVSTILQTMESFRDRFLAAAMNGDRSALATTEAERLAAIAALGRHLPADRVLRALTWPDRRKWLALALHERDAEWLHRLFAVYETDLHDQAGPGTGWNAWVLGVTAERLAALTVDDSTRARELADYAGSAYRTAAASPFLLRDEAIYRLWKLARETGDTTGARAWADTLALSFPRSVRTPQIRLTRAEALLEEGRPADALEEARLALPVQDSAELRWLMARAALDLAFPRVAARELEHLIGSYGRDPLAVSALDARVNLAQEDQELHLDPDDWLALAVHLLPNPESAMAETLTAKFRDKSWDPELREQAGLAVARHLYKSRKYAAAETMLKKLRTSSTDEVAEESDLILGRIFRNTGRLGPMKKHYRAVIRRNGSEASRAFWELGREMESLARWSEAEAVYTEYLEGAEITPRFRDMLFRRGFCRVRRDRLTLAAEDFREAFRRSTNPADEEQAAFWLARTLESLGKSDEAMSAARAGASTPDPQDGYGVLIRQRFLNEPAKSPFNEAHRFESEGLLDLVDVTEWPARVQHHFQRGLILAEMGEVHTARLEWNRARALGRRLPSLIQGLALVAAAFDLYPEGVRWANQASGTLSVDHPLQTGFKRLAYPPAFYGDVFHHSVKNELDPAAIWALMRQESMYDPLAVSRVGALGLMQIMPYTLDRINREAGRPRQAPDVLFKPQVNLALGIRFFSDRFQEFDQNLLPTLASYNAGESKSWQWLGRAGGDTQEVFIECIGYPETYSYARRILWLNWVYSTYYRPASGDRNELR